MASQSIQEILMAQVEKRGMANSLVSHYIRDLEKSIFVRPHETHSEINEHMHHLGWPEIEVDYHLFELAKACMTRN